MNPNMGRKVSGLGVLRLWNRFETNTSLLNPQPKAMMIFSLRMIFEFRLPSASPGDLKLNEPRITQIDADNDLSEYLRISVKSAVLSACRPRPRQNRTS